MMAMPKDNYQSVWLTADDVAELLRVKRSTVWRWARDGKLPAVRFGRLIRFRSVDVENFMKAGCV